jgi:putative methionine-R-sulfoxide reductase with GAF domain
MDRSIRSLTDPIAGPPIGERRRNLRHKLHTPVYASFNGPQSGMVVDLSELLNLNEEGFAVQTGERLDVKRAVTVCLDLPETKNYLHCTGQVIWSDDSGRGGIRFSPLSERSRQVLKEWLFANLMIGCSNHSARSEQRAQRAEEKSLKPEPVANAPRLVPISDGSATLSAVEAVRLVIRDIGNDLEAILQLVTERALAFTGASGAALALITDGKMICRARAGTQAPPLGATVDVKQGLSGECVRRRLLVSCEDTENDPRVDPEVCRALDIRSLMAAPIAADLQVIGLLEIFSPQARRFVDVHAVVLERLIELIPKTREQKTPSEPASGETPIRSKTISVQSHSSGSDTAPTEATSIHIGPEAFLEPGIESEKTSENFHEQNAFEPVPGEAPEIVPEARSRLVYRALMGMAIVAIFVVLGYLIAPVIDKRWAVSPQASQRSSSGTPSGVSTGSVNDSGTDSSPAASGHSSANVQLNYLTELRNLAAQGNADAEWQLGARYHNGDGVLKDDVQAMQWFQRAAEQGHVSAEATLGAYYWAGRGVPQDLSKAYFWSAVAFAQGDENSKPRLDGLSTQMTREQILAAQQQADAWIRNHNVQFKSTAN